MLNYFFLEEPFFELFFDPFFELFFGTFAPSARASDRPIAIACFLLVTFLPDLPLFNVPCLRSCMAFSTFLPAFLLYLAISPLLPGSFVYYSPVVTLDHGKIDKFVWQNVDKRQRRF